MGNVIMKAQQIVYGASNVEKALDDLKAPELIELNKRMAAIDEWKANVHEVTYTGSELAIDNALALPARSLVTEINAIQDLHGYDKPWAGGAGKNQLRMTADNIKAANGGSSYWTDNSKVINNITVTILTDNGGNVEGIKLNGTASANTYIYIVPNNLGGGFDNLTVNTAYIINGGATGVALRAWHYDNVNIASSNGADASFTLTSDGKTNGSVDIFINNGTALNNVVIKPMIRLSTESDATFAPYSNICPISGRTAVVVNRSDGDEISEDFTIQLGTTVYGAEINWDTGVMTVKTAFKTFDGSEGWAANGTIGYLITRSQSGMPDVKAASSANTYCLSNLFPKSGITWADKSIGIDGGTVWIGDADNVVFGDLAGFKSFLANTNLQLEYELATPTAIQLTPTQLQMLKGYNRVTIEDGSIELKALVLGGDN